MTKFTHSNWKCGDLNFVFEDKEEFSNYYAFETLVFLQRIQANIETARSTLSSGVHPETEKRLTSYIEGQRLQYESLGKLLSPLGAGKISHQDSQAYIQHHHGPSALSPNYENVFRDWCWGEEEVNESVGVLDKLSLKMNTNAWENVLFLGAGGGRVPYELHLQKKIKKNTILDINPLLVLISQKIISGETLELIEFPRTPQVGNSYWFKRKLQTKNKISSNIDFVVSDARVAIFEKEQFSTVVTPWLIDVVDMVPEDFYSVINHYLPQDGYWVNTGPMQFEYKGAQFHYSVDEIREFVKESGFEILEESIDQVPYMKSLQKGGYRVEEIYSFVAKKVKNVELVEFNPLFNMPDWYLDHNKEIHLPVDQLNLVNAYEFNAKILTHIGGDKSLNEVTDILTKEFSEFERSQLKYLIAQIIKNSVYSASLQPF